MTMPDERTRALRFGLEYLLELEGADNITVEQRSQVKILLRHYPSTSEIKDWAIFEFKKQMDDEWSMFKLEPEVEPVVAVQNLPLSPDSFERGPTSPSDRTRALRLAEQLFMDLRSAENLTHDQKRQIPYVLRHYPNSLEISSWAETYAKLRAKGPDPEFVMWLAPEVDLHD